jgi:DNA-binding MarR family transcriptional regulator
MLGCLNCPAGTAGAVMWWNQQRVGLQMRYHEPRTAVLLAAPALLAPVDSADFSSLRMGLGVADSVVSKHLATLEGAGYLAIHKGRCGPLRRTTVSLTPLG